MIDNRASRRLAKVGRGAKNEIGRPSLLREYLSRRVARRRRSVRGVTSGHTVWQPFRSADTSCAFVGSTTSAAAPIRRLSPPPYTYYIYVYPAWLRSPSRSTDHPATDACPSHSSTDLASTMRRLKCPLRGVNLSIRRRQSAPAQAPPPGSDCGGPSSEWSGGSVSRGRCLHFSVFLCDPITEPHGLCTQ